MAHRRIVLLAVVLAALAGCATQPMSLSIADTIAANPQLSTLSGLVVKSGLNTTLLANGPHTVFAPTNAAFAKVPAKTMDALAADPAKLKDVLTYHVLPIKVMAADVRNGDVKTLNGASLALSKAGNFVTVEDAVVQTADIAASNGVLHIVDSVLIPPAR